ncbi:MAG TPA: M23 family metallopeptidase [Kofleriaceae bacterium]|nr:M23 family metallopeptidase [Kofleriaceae bacterium]
MRLHYAALILVALSAPALAAPNAPNPKLSATKARPGQALLVTVAGAEDAPTGKAGDAKLEFFKSKTGYQAVFAVPLDTKPGPLAVIVDDTKLTVDVQDVTFPEADVVVEDEYANPGKAEREQIDADNQAILKSFEAAAGPPQFTLAFQRPPGHVTSGFGEWRTFNDGHRSQHLGLDVTAREGSRVRAINAGTVVLVRDCFLAGTVVVIAHGAGIASAYYHLSKTDVAEGDTVKRGQLIGRAGHTGRATGPHLHVSVRAHGGWVDPASFFKLAIAPARTATARR